MRTLIVAMLIAGCSGPPAPKPTVLPMADRGWPLGASPPAPTPPTFRLPTDVMPIRQRLELTIVPTQPRTTGAIHVDADVASPTRVVWLNATDLHVHGATVNGKPVRVVVDPRHGDVVGLVADAAFPVGPLAIDALFDAPIDAERSRGMYSAIDDGEPYVYTFFESIDARRAFPCFDEPSFKIPWTLVFHVREHDVALGNAPVVNETPEPNGMKRVELAESKPLPSYLVAFVVGPFDVIDDGLAGRANTPVRFVVPKGHAGELDFAKQVTPRDRRRARRLLRHAVSVRQARCRGRAALLGNDGASRHRRDGPTAHADPARARHARPRGALHGHRSRTSSATTGSAISSRWSGGTTSGSTKRSAEWLDMITTDAVMPKWHYRDRRIEPRDARDVGRRDDSVKPMHREITEQRSRSKARSTTTSRISKARR